MMASKSASSKKFVESLQSDLRSLSNEAKRKFPPVKEAAEAGILRLRTISAKSASPDVIQSVTDASADLIQPFVLGCDTKHVKIIPICLSGIQRLISHNAVSKECSSLIINVLWSLMEAGLEELKLLQTAVLLLNTSNDVMHGDMAKALVLCFRLHFTKDPTTMNTAAATIRQLVSVVFERVVVENATNTNAQKPISDADMENLKLGGREPPPSLLPCAQDAFLLFQDLCQLVNADQPFWLLGMTEMTRTFGLELMESVLADYPDVILGHEEFRFLLKERVCPLVIKLFSPSIKYRAGLSINNGSGGTNQDKPYFPIVMRLLRIVAVLIKTYYSLLITECEIFLSLLVKFLDGDKPTWQRALAIEVLHKLCVQPLLVQSFVECYDMKQHSTKVFRDIVNAIGTFIQSLFVSPPMSPSSNAANANSGAKNNAASTPDNASGFNGNGISGQGSFAYRGVVMPICVTFPPGTTRAVYLEMMDKTENPTVLDGYGIAVAYACLLDVVKTLHCVIQGEGSGDKMRDVDGEGLGGKRKPASSPPSIIGDVDADKMREEMVQSSWCGLLAALSFLLDASTEETVTESILKSLQIFASMAGHLKLTVPRDAFVTSLCKASLPPHYALTILSQACAGASSGKSPTAGPSESGFEIGMCGGNGKFAGNNGLNNNNGGVHQGITNNVNANGASSPEEAMLLSDGDPRAQQVVAVGNPLPTPYQSSSSAATSGPVMLTAKNLQCMRGLLNMAHCHGAVLGTRCWHLVLTTLQHLVWILGLKPVGGGGGSLKPTGTRLNDNSNTVLTNAVMQDLPVLSSMLSRLFESSNLLDDDSLQHLIQALGRLSSEAMDVAYSNREPSLFPLAKILETGLVNLNRLRVFYKPVTDHLLDVSRHPQQKIREWGAEALTTLIRSALTHEHLPTPLTENPELRALILKPLEDMSLVNYFDSRQKQLDCVLQILHSKGDSLGDGWPLVLGVLGAATQFPSSSTNDSSTSSSPSSPSTSAQSTSSFENLIRSGFQGLQLVVTDFLPTMPKRCLRISVVVTAKYGLQTQDVNISLTSIGLMWNISDFICQRQDFIRKQLESEEAEAVKNGKEADKETGEDLDHSSLSPLDELWLVIYKKLGELCTDERPAVRKSAGQTLFSTISTHGDLLHSQSWRSVLWDVLFPMLSRVRKLSMTASTEKAEVGNILIHHSRDTAKKQWSETQTLTLTGVARVFSTKRNTLEESLKKKEGDVGGGNDIANKDFLDAWCGLLDFIETSALSPDVEVSLAALQSLQEILNIVPDESNVGGNASFKANGLGRKHLSLTARMIEAPAGEAPSGLVVEKVLWDNVWKVWTSIGLNATLPANSDANEDADDSGKASSSECSPASVSATSSTALAAKRGAVPVGSGAVYVPSQPFLTALMNIFPVLFSHVKPTFEIGDFDKLARVLKGALAVPVQGDSAPFLVPSFTELSLTPLQEKVLLATESLKEEILSGSHPQILEMAPSFASLLFAFSNYSISPPRFGSLPVLSSSTLGSKAALTADWVAMNYVIFAESALNNATSFYATTASRPCVIAGKVGTGFLTALRTPLSLKYDCPAGTTWKLAVESLISVVESTLPIIVRPPPSKSGDSNSSSSSSAVIADAFWMELAKTLDEFWFSPSVAPPLSLEQHRHDETYDVRLVCLLRDKILPLSSAPSPDRRFASPPPPQFDAEVMKLLNRGSIHVEAAASAFVDPDSSRKLREDFAKACFQTLLRYSFAHPEKRKGEINGDPSNNNNDKDGATTAEDVSRLAVESLLQRCHQVLTLYVRDEQLSGNCPLPRHRLAELTSVLKAVTLLVATLKTSNLAAVHQHTWQQVIGLYPALVNCISSGSTSLCSALKEALIEYHQLLTVPLPVILASPTPLPGLVAATSNQPRPEALTKDVQVETGNRDWLEGASSASALESSSKPALETVKFDLGVSHVEAGAGDGDVEPEVTETDHVGEVVLDVNVASDELELDDSLC